MIFGLPRSEKSSVNEFFRMIQPQIVQYKMISFICAISFAASGRIFLLYIFDDKIIVPRYDTSCFYLVYLCVSHIVVVVVFLQKCLKIFFFQAISNNCKIIVTFQFNFSEHFYRSKWMRLWRPINIKKLASDLYFCFWF